MMLPIMTTFIDDLINIVLLLAIMQMDYELLLCCDVQYLVTLVTALSIFQKFNSVQSTHFILPSGREQSMHFTTDYINLVCLHVIEDLISYNLKFCQVKFSANLQLLLILATSIFMHFQSVAQLNFKHL